MLPDPPGYNMGMRDNREQWIRVAANLLLGVSITFTILGVVRFTRTVVNGQPRVAFYAIWGLAGGVWALNLLRDRAVSQRLVSVGLLGGVAAQISVVFVSGGSPTVFTLVTPLLLGGLALWIVRSHEPLRLARRSITVFRRGASNPPWEPTRKVLLAAGLVGLGIVAIGTAVLVTAAPLGWDESVYALKAQAWLEGTPSTGFGIHRPVGMAAVAAVVFRISESVLALRVGAAIASLLALVAVLRLGIMTRRTAAAVVTVVSFAAGQPYLRRAPEFLNDLATSGLLIGVLIIVWRASESHERSLPLWYASVLSGAAFYLRYGSALVVFVIVVVAGVMFHARVREQSRSIVIAATVLAALILPHLVYARSTTGSFLGILTKSSEAAGRAYLGDGLVRYVAWFPAKLTGAALAVVILVGFAHVIVHRRSTHPKDRLDRFVVTVAAISGIAVGLTVHGEQRYVFFNVLLLSFVGWSALLSHARDWSDGLRRVAAVAVVGALLLSFGTGVFEARLRSETLGDQRAVLRDVGDTLSSDGPCVIVTSYIPQLTWTSGCATVTFTAAFRDSFAPTPGQPTYVVTFENGKRQPEQKEFDEFLDRFGVISIQPIESITDRIGDATVYRI